MNVVGSRASFIDAKHGFSKTHELTGSDFGSMGKETRAAVKREGLLLP
jgi:hypothetical protein